MRVVSANEGVRARLAFNVCFVNRSGRARSSRSSGTEGLMSSRSLIPIESPVAPSTGDFYARSVTCRRGMEAAVYVRPLRDGFDTNRFPSMKKRRGFAAQSPA